MYFTCDNPILIQQKEQQKHKTKVLIEQNFKDLENFYRDFSGSDALI